MNMKYLFTFIALIALFGSSLSLNLKKKAKQEEEYRCFNPWIYTIQSGDSLTAIANRFGDTVKDIQSRNNIQNANLIFGGQKIQVCRLQFETCRENHFGITRCTWINAK